MADSDCPADRARPRASSECSCVGLGRGGHHLHRRRRERRAAARAKPIGSLTQMAHHPARQAHRGPHPADQGLRAAGRRSTTSSSAPGTRSRTTPTRRRSRAACSTSTSTSSRSPTSSRRIKPMPAVFDQHYVKRLEGTNVKTGKTKRELAEALRKDIRDFKAKHGCDRLVMVWCASTEIFIAPGPDPPDAGGLREGDGRQRPDHRPVDALRLRRHHGGRAVRQRRAEPQLRHPGARAAGPRARACRSAARTSRPARRC